MKTENWEKKWKLFIEGKVVSELGVNLENSITDPEKVVKLFYTQVLREPYYVGGRRICSKHITFFVPDQNREYMVIVCPTDIGGASVEELNGMLSQNLVKILRHVNSAGKSGYVKPDIYIEGTEAFKLKTKIEVESKKYIEENSEVICRFFEQNGYYLTHDDSKGTAYLRFIPKATKPLSREEVNKLSGGYFYHFSPSIYDNTIKSEGLKVRNDKVSLNYSEPRLYLWPGKQADSRGSLTVIKSTVASLMQIAKSKETSREEKKRYNTISRYRVEVPENYSIYLDLEYPQNCNINPVYVVQDLPVQSIQEVKHFDISNLVSNISGVKGRLVPLDEN